MDFYIHDIGSIAPDSFPLYFCDANVWIDNLRYVPLDHETPYQNFFTSIVNLNNITEPKLVKKIKNKPKIILTSMVLSEVVNAYMRNVAMKEYYDDKAEYDIHDFKKYRDDPASDYYKQLSSLCSDISAYSDYILLLNDEFDKIEPFTLLSVLPTLPMDFNDLYYCTLLKDKGIPIITNDRDFKFEKIEIITANRELLRFSTL